MAKNEKNEKWLENFDINIMYKIDPMHLDIAVLEFKLNRSSFNLN